MDIIKDTEDIKYMFFLLDNIVEMKEDDEFINYIAEIRKFL